LRIFLLLSFLISTSLFALVSIAPVDIGSKAGFSGNISGSLNSQSGNTQKDEYSLGLRAQYDQGTDYLAWGILTYSYGTSNGTKNEDKTYTHLRYIHSLYEDNWCSETFIQTEQDKFKDIYNRSIVGTGVRWRFFNSEEWGKGYAGMGGMIEQVNYTSAQSNPNESNGRLNSYIAYTEKFLTASKISYVGYFQPKFDDAADYVTSQTVEISIPIYKNLGLGATGKYAYDSSPPIGISKKDTSLITSLMWEF
jgi:putative salt-induced outer membrane protein YdiY